MFGASKALAPAQKLSARQDKPYLSDIASPTSASLVRAMSLYILEVTSGAPLAHRLLTRTMPVLVTGKRSSGSTAGNIFPPQS